MKEKSVENVILVYLSGMLAHKGGCVAILSDIGTEFKNKVLNEACDELGAKRLLSNLFHPQGNSRIENDHNFLKYTLTKFLESIDPEWDNLLLFACYCYYTFPSNNGTESLFFLMFRCDPAEE